MQITSVQYSRLVNLGNYENQKVAAWGNLEEGETADEALSKLMAWVDGRVNEQAEAADELRQLRHEISTRRQELRALEDSQKEGKARWERAKEFLTALGIPLPDRFRDDDIPF